MYKFKILLLQGVVNCREYANFLVCITTVKASNMCRFPNI